MYQQRLKSRNKQINIAIDNRLIAQQIRDHQIKFRSKNRTLLKPSVLSEIHIKAEEDDLKENISDPENEIKLNGKENHKEGFVRNFTQPNALQDNRNNFANALSKVKEALRYVILILLKLCMKPIKKPHNLAKLRMLILHSSLTLTFCLMTASYLSEICQSVYHKYASVLDKYCKT